MKNINRANNEDMSSENKKHIFKNSDIYDKKSELANVINNRYNHKDIEQKVQEIWALEKTFEVDLKNAKNPYYNLMMFPYPSAEGLHVGNFYAFTGADVYGRYKRLQGFEVFEPMGMDAFGIHSENFAIKKNIHPTILTEKNIKNFREQLKKLGALFDWNYEINTTSPEYYRWNQWLFLKLYESGMVYRNKGYVNRCPECQTVISDEQVINGKCERHGETLVEKKELEQRFLKITDFADELYTKLDGLDRSNVTKLTQKNRIGKSEGTEVKFTIEGTQDSIEVFTSRVDTISGATFLVIAPDSDLAKKIVPSEKRDELDKMINSKSFNKTIEKEGIKTDIYVVNPINNQTIPVYIANYIVSGYGTGAVMGVPAHDERDYEFSQKYSLDNISVYEEGSTELKNSGMFNGLDRETAIQKITDYLEQNNQGKKCTKYKLRDRCISRQRYWGTPIPIVYCEDCGLVPEKEEKLPIILPYIEDFKPKGDPNGPLSQCQEFIETSCPCCNKPARRESHVMDNFFDSSWYFFRYLTPKDDKNIFDKDLVNKWMPIESYIGGNEHAVLHLMYTRFITKALHKIGLIDFDEPFKKFFAHGLLIKDGKKMSKSKGNVINPDEYIEKYGTDALRMYLMSLGPLDSGGDFTDTGIQSIYEFIKDINELFLSKKVISDKPIKNPELIQEIVAVCDEAYNKFKYNVVISRLKQFYNYLLKQDSISAKESEIFLKLLSPITPHLTEGIWRLGLNKDNSIHLGDWPKTEVRETNVSKVVICINGKPRGDIEVPKDTTQEEITNLIRQTDNKYNKYIEGKEIKKIIYVKEKIFNVII